MTTDVQPNKPLPELADVLYWERVKRAREMSPEEKFLAGEQLFEYACAITLAGIRDEFAGYSDEQCMGELKRRLALRERLEGVRDGN
jgi:hypothetical protein